MYPITHCWQPRNNRLNVWKWLKVCAEARDDEEIQLVVARYNKTENALEIPFGLWNREIWAGPFFQLLRIYN